MIRKIPVLIILISAVSLIFSVPQPFRFICGFLQVFVLPGMIFSYLFLGAGFSKADRSFFSILISPILISLLVIAVTALTGDIYFSVRVTLAVLYLFLVAVLVLRRKGRMVDEDTGMPWQVLVIAVIFSGIVLSSYLYNSFLLFRSDSWYHASVINEIANRGIPPMEPWLADFPIKYMWFYHLFNAVWMELSGLPIFWAMGIFNVVAAFVFPYLIARYISCFTEKKYLIISASVLALAGLESVSWIFLPAGLLRTLFGEVRGAAEIQRMLSSMVVNGASVIHTLTPYGSWMVNLYDKFITITAFSYSLNLFLAALILVLNRKFLQESRVRSSIVLFTLVLGTILFHAVTGTALAMTIVGACILLVIFGRRLLKDSPGFEVKYLPMAAAFLAAVLGLPYVLSLGAGAGGDGGNVFSEHLHLGIRSILTILLPLLVLFFPARKALEKLIGRRDYRSAVLICWSAALLVIAITINLPTVNDSKLIFPLFLIIGPPIYIEIVEKIRENSGVKRGLIVFAVVVLFFVPPFMTIRGFIIQKANSEILTRRDNITEEDMRFFEWIRENTPDDSIIIENNIYHLVPVFADRRNLYSTQGVIRVLGYSGEKMEMYKKIKSSLYGQDGFTEETIREMGRIHSKLYVALWREDLETAPWLADRFSEESKYFKQVFASDRVSLYTLRDDLD